MSLVGEVTALAERVAEEFNAVRGELSDPLGGVIDCSSMTLASEVNAATLGAPASTRVLLGPHGSGTELGVDETLILRPNLRYEGPGGRSRLCRLKATAGFPAGQPLVAAAGYLTNETLCDSPVVLRGVDIDADGKVGSDGLVVFHFWSTFEDIQIHNVTGNGTLSATAAIRIANRGIDGTTVTTNSHSENVFRDIRINAPAAGASNIVQESYSSGAAPGGNGGAANQDGHLVGAWFAGGTGTGSGRGLDFARAAGWTFRDIHMYGIGDDAARLLACYATDISGLYVENYGVNDTAADSYNGLQMEFLRGRGSTLSNVKISSSQPESPAATRFTNYHLRAGGSQVNAMVTLSSCTSNLNKTTAPTSRKTQAWRYGESGDTGRSLYVKAAACQTDPLDGWMSPTRFVHATTVVLDEPASTIVRTQTFSATPTIDPTIDGNVIDMTATADITALAVSTTGAVNGQQLRVRVLASGATRAVTVASAVRTTTGVTRGPYSVPTGELVELGFEYSTLTAAWHIVGALVTAT